MTNDEAIDLLDNLIGMISDNQDSDYDEALKLGIKALSREADYYENEIADLQNRLDIAEYDKERYKEEITTLKEDLSKHLSEIYAEIARNNTDYSCGFRYGYKSAIDDVARFERW